MPRHRTAWPQRARSADGRVVRVAGLHMLVMIASSAQPGLAQESARPSPATADSPERAVTSYTAGFFAEFQPTTVLDMINRIPGFVYDRGNSGVRGLAAAGGNVLIDGQRPSTKSLTLDDIIRRVPLSAVERIDVIRGAAPGIDMQGHSTIVNVVRTPGGYSVITGELIAKLYTDDVPGRTARLEGSFSDGPLSIDGSLRWGIEKDQATSGVGRLVRRAPDGSRLSSGRFEADWVRRLVQANGAAEYRGARSLLRLNLGGEHDRSDRRDLARLTTSGGQPRDEAIVTDFGSDQGEISLDYERELSARLSGRVLALQRLEHDRTIATSIGDGPPQASSEDAVEGESILRGSATYVPSPTLTLEASIEGAFNFLDAETALERGGEPIALPSASIRVEELRTDVAGSARWQALDRATVDLGVALEKSTISQSGDVEQSKSLQYFKPRAGVAIDPDDDWQLRFRVERLVGQLNFGDFAASASLDAGDISGGNPDLVPERSWHFEAAVEHRFWARGAATVTLSHARVADVIDLIPIDGRFDAPGNIGDGTRQELRLALAVPFQRLGIPGAFVRFNGSWRRSEVTDPVTGERRRVSRQRPFAGEIFVTKDLPAMDSVIGADFFLGFEEKSYRIDEIRVERATSEPLSRLYWDWMPDPGTAVRLQLENFTFRRRGRDRFIFEGSRASGRLVSIEHRSVVLDPFLMVRLRKGF